MLTYNTDRDVATWTSGTTDRVYEMTQLVNESRLSAWLIRPRLTDYELSQRFPMFPIFMLRRDLNDGEMAWGLYELLFNQPPMMIHHVSEFEWAGRAVEAEMVKRGFSMLPAIDE